ncbi:MAG: hypothetical protein ACREU6_00800 [Steroidobacteraceae bacterium]
MGSVLLGAGCPVRKGATPGYWFPRNITPIPATFLLNRDYFSSREPGIFGPPWNELPDVIASKSALLEKASRDACPRHPLDLKRTIQ